MRAVSLRRLINGKLENDGTSLYEFREAFDAEGADPSLHALSTGGGKMIVFKVSSASGVAHGTRTCILVHRLEPLDQTCRALDAQDVQHRVIESGHREFADLITHGQLVPTTGLRSRAGDYDRRQFEELVRNRSIFGDVVAHAGNPHNGCCGQEGESE